MKPQQVLAKALSNGFEIIEEGGTEYLAHDVVAQREGVYFYPTPDGGVTKELVTAEELHSSIDDAGEEPLLIDHPDAPDNTPNLTTNPRANYTEVGLWREHEPIEDGIKSRALIEVDEIGEHGGDLIRYLRDAIDGKAGEVSTGYGITRAVSESGRHNGMAYDAKQQGLSLDHLALLPNAIGDCSVEDGCGLGRANEHENVLARTNNHIPTADDGESPEDSWRTNVSYKTTSVSYDEFTDEEWDGGAAESGFPNPSEDDDAPDVLDQVYAAIPEDDRSAKSNWKLPFRTGPGAPINTRALVAIQQAIKGARGGIDDMTVSTADAIMDWTDEMLMEAPDDLYGSITEDRGNLLMNIGRRIASRFNTMDDDKIQTLVEEYGFSRENIEHLEGTQCLDRIHDAVVNGDADVASIVDERVNEVVDEKVDDLVADKVDDRLNELVADKVEDTVDERVNEVIDDEFDIDEDEIAERAAKLNEQSREHEQNIEKIAESDNPLEREQLERMNEDVVADIADDLGDEDDDDRTNFAGRPTGDSFDMSDYDGDDMDVATGGQSLGDD